MKVINLSDFDTVLRIFYTYPELGNKQISELFGGIKETAIGRYKKKVQERQAAEGVRTSLPHTVNTRIAFQVWGIDVDDLEKRREKLKKLGFL